MTLEVPTASYLLDPDADLTALLDALGIAPEEAGDDTALRNPPAGGTGERGRSTVSPVAPGRPGRLVSTPVDGLDTSPAGIRTTDSAPVHVAGGPPGRSGKEPATVSLVLLDTADRLLRAAGLELAATAGTRAPVEREVGEASLMLRGRPGEPPVRAVVARARRYLIPELPPGPLRERLAPIVGIRALLPIVEVQRQELPAAVRNADGKIVVRLTVARLSARPASDAALASGHGQGAAAGLLPPPASDESAELHTRIDLTGVLGYPKAFARVREALSSPPLSLPEASESVADEAVTALGGIPQGLAGKVDVGLRPDDRADVAAVRILRSLAHQVESNLPGTLDGLDTEFLHDLRVAVRKSRSVLRELKRVFEPEARQVQADALRWVQAVTGPTRDLDVQLLEWDDVVGHLPDERRREHLEPVRALLHERRAKAFAALVDTLEGDAFRQRWSAWRGFLAGDLGPEDQRPDAARPVREVAGRRIDTVYKRMVRMGRAIDDASPAQSLHDLRKRGKELRYLLELFGGLWPSATVKPLVTKLKGLQNVLGLHQDREVQADQLRTLAPDLTPVPGGADALLSMGSLVDALEHQQHGARQQFAEWFDAFQGADLPR